MRFPGLFADERSVPSLGDTKVYLLNVLVQGSLLDLSGRFLGLGTYLENIQVLLLGEYVTPKYVAVAHVLF